MRHDLVCGSAGVACRIYRICHGSPTCGFFCFSLWILDVERKGLAILQRDVTVNLLSVQLTSLTRRTVTKANNVTRWDFKNCTEEMMGTVYCLFGKIFK